MRALKASAGLWCSDKAAVWILTPNEHVAAETEGRQRWQGFPCSNVKRERGRERERKNPASHEDKEKQDERETTTSGEELLFHNNPDFYKVTSVILPAFLSAESLKTTSRVWNLQDDTDDQTQTLSSSEEKHSHASLIIIKHLFMTYDLILQLQGC